MNVEGHDRLYYSSFSYLRQSDVPALVVPDATWSNVNVGTDLVTSAYNSVMLASFDLTPFGKAPYQVSGLAYDPATDRLFVGESGNYGPSYVHVFYVQPPGPDVTPPATITNLAVTRAVNSTATLTWTAPADTQCDQQLE